MWTPRPFTLYIYKGYLVGLGEEVQAPNMDPRAFRGIRGSLLGT